MGHTGSVEPVVFSPSGNLIATGSFDKAVRIYGAKTGAPHREPLPHQYPVAGLEFFSDELLLTYAAKFDGPSEISVWDISSGTRVAGSLEFGGEIFAAKWGPLGKKICARFRRTSKYGVTEEQRTELSRPLLWEWRSNDLKRLQTVSSKRVDSV